jgi:rod shape-determining protein MreD
VKTAKMLLAILAALTLQTTLARFIGRGTAGVDLVLVAVTYVGLTSGPVLGLVAGTLAGLAQDALGTGIIGIGGLAKTVVGFLAGVIGTQFIVAQVAPRFLVFAGATLAQAGVVVGLGLLLSLEPAPRSLLVYAGEAIGNALVGIALFQAIELLPGALERRRANRNRVRASRLRN